jgi:hypothetical protein
MKVSRKLQDVSVSSKVMLAALKNMADINSMNLPSFSAGVFS